MVVNDVIEGKADIGFVSGAILLTLIEKPDCIMSLHASKMHLCELI